MRRLSSRAVTKKMQLIFGARMDRAVTRSKNTAATFQLSCAARLILFEKIATRIIPCGASSTGVVKDWRSVLGGYDPTMNSSLSTENYAHYMKTRS